MELCSALNLGGLTPSMGVLADVRESTRLPIMRMIRPRGGDFRYDEREIAASETEIEAARDRGADGFVFGALLADGRVDAGSCRRLIAKCASRPSVFHRAFDLTPDPFVALEQIIDLGFARMLTSGRCPDASRPEATALTARLIDRAAGRIEIMPGGGIRPHNAAEIVRATGCVQVHSSCRLLGGNAVDDRVICDLRRVLDSFP